MAQTITSGILANDGVTIRPLGSITWADLGSSPYSSWENWTSWTESPQNIVVNEVYDAGTSAYRVPLVSTEVGGTLTVTVDVSDTGLFAGEQSTISFASDDVGQDLIKGRYYRWNFTVAPNADYPIPYLQYFTEVSSRQVDYYLEDVAVPALATDSLGFRLIDHSLGAVTHVQATTLQGDDYVDNGYYLTFALLDSYVRSANTSLITVGGTPTYVDSYAPRLSKAIKFNGVDQYVEFDNTARDLIDGYPYTMEFLFKVPPISGSDNRADTRHLVVDNWDESIPNIDLLIRVVDGTQTSTGNSEVWTQIAGLTNAQIKHTPFPIEGDRWYHYSITFYNAQSIRSVIATLDGENSGSGVGEGAGDAIETTDFTYDSELPDTIMMGRSVSGSTVYNTFTDVVIDEFRITNGAEENASDYWDSGLLVTPLISKPNTTMLLHFDNSIQDDNLVRTGTDDYTLRQNGGSAVVESKNPLALKVVDYNGDAWDGAIDLHLRGLPKIAKLGNNLITKFD